MPNASTNWMGTITRISRNVNLIASSKAASFDHRLERAEGPVARLVSQGEPEALDHRPHEEQAEVGDGGEDQPVGQSPPTVALGA